MPRKMVLRLVPKHSNSKNLCFWGFIMFLGNFKKCSKINAFPAFVLKIIVPKNLFLGGGFRFWELVFRFWELVFHFWGRFWEIKTGRKEGFYAKEEL